MKNRKFLTASDFSCVNIITSWKAGPMFLDSTATLKRKRFFRKSLLRERNLNCFIYLLKVLKMKLIVEEKDKIIENNVEAVKESEVKRRRESVEAQDLRSMVDSKCKEIESMTKKVSPKKN